MKVIIIGLGIQGKKRLTVVGSDLVATVDPVISEAQYKNIDDVSLDEYDAALVCTPDEPKIALLTYLLSNGKHVLVEKPLISRDQGQLKKLSDLCNSKGVTCYTAYNHRFEPHIQRLKSHIDSGDLGKIYYARFFYGNGTAREVRNSSWRDKGPGVLSDLGSHLLDLGFFLFKEIPEDFRLWNFNRFENKAPDYIRFGSNSGLSIEMEATLLSWRNTFLLDVIGKKGSAHINCLCKWGPSSFSFRKRKLPSGKPDEETITVECPDPTWSQEYIFFKKICNQGISTLSNDIKINAILNKIASEGNMD